MLLNEIKLEKKMRLQLLKLNNLQEKMKNTNNKEEFILLAKTEFKALKEWIYDYYNPLNNTIHTDYNTLLATMNKINYPNIYLFPVNLNTYFDANMNHDITLLTRIVAKIRAEITTSECASAKSLAIDEIDYNLAEKNIKAMTLGILKFLHINYQLIEINTGFLDNNILNPKVMPHYAFIINLGSDKYLLDIAYPRYFKIKNNIIDALGVVGYDPVDVGFYMENDPKRKEFATTLINKGFIKINEENLKFYGDGFALAFRNGLYYDYYNNLDFTTNYSAKDYLKFFNGEDNQMLHEGVRVLGRQKIPVINKDLFNA